MGHGSSEGEPLNLGTTYRMTLNAQRSFSKQEFAQWVDEMSTKLAGESLDLDQKFGPVKTFRCLDCQDTGFILNRKEGMFGTEITWARRCDYSPAIQPPTKPASSRKRMRGKSEPTRVREIFGGDA